MLSTISSVVKHTGLRMQRQSFSTPWTWSNFCHDSFQTQIHHSTRPFLIRCKSVATLITTPTNSLDETKARSSNNNVQGMAEKAVPKKSWTPKECLTLSRLLAEGIRDVSEIQQHFPNRTPRAIKTRIALSKYLSGKNDRRTSRKWTPEEDEKLMAFMLQGKMAKEIENEFPGRTPCSVITQFYAFDDNLDGLTARSINRRRFGWTAEEDERLYLAIKENATMLEVQHLLPSRTFSAVKSRMYELRHFKTPDTVHQMEQYKGDRTQDHTLDVAADDKAPTEKQTNDKSVASALHFRRTRPWTLEEDKLLTDLVTKHQTDLTQLWNKMDDAYQTGQNGDIRLMRTGAAARTRLSQLQDQSKYRTGALDAEEIKRLKQAIQEQIGDKFQVMVDVRQEGHDIPKDVVTKTNTTEQDTRPGLKLGGPELTHLDWEKIAQQVGNRHRRQCRSYLHNALHNGRRGTWTIDELQRLEEAVNKYGRDWKIVAAHVGTRAPHQAANCFLRSISQNKN